MIWGAFWGRLGFLRVSQNPLLPYMYLCGLGQGRVQRTFKLKGLMVRVSSCQGIVHRRQTEPDEEGEAFLSTLTSPYLRALRNYIPGD